MTQTEHEKWAQERLPRLKTLRDEIRVHLHLAGMDARDKWRQLEPKLWHAEKIAKEVGATSREKLDELVDHFKSFKGSLRARH